MKPDHRSEHRALRQGGLCPAALRRLALPVASALAAGLYLARLWCERRPQATGWLVFAAFLALGLALSALAVSLLRRRGEPTWPLLLLGAYALWPLPNSRLALAAGIVSAVALLLAQRTRPRLPGWLADLGAGGLALALYVATLAPSVQPADAGEFQLVGSVLGIAHPPGYPLYTMLAKVFTLLPLGDPAWRVNLFAAVCAAATVAVVSRLVRRATRSAGAGILAALALASVPTFWSQATLANARSLTALLTALAMYWLLAYGEAHRARSLVAFAVTFGLGVTHHSSIGLLALPFAAYLLAVDGRLFLQPRRWLAPAAGLLAPLLVLLYLPLRSAMNPPFDTPSVRTLGGLVAHVLALGFQGDVLYYLGRPTLGPRLGILGDILRLELGWGLTAAALVLGALAGRRRWPPALLWGGVAIVNAFAAITYRAPQTVEYLLPAYVALAVGLGLGLGWLFGARAGSPVPALIGGLAAWLALSNGLAAYPSYAALHRDNSARTQAIALLEAAPPGALILSNWHRATPLWYLQEVEGLRPDVTVTYVYPEGATPNGQVWARRIQEAVAERAVIVTNRYNEFAGLPYRLVPLEGAWRVESGGGEALPQGLDGGPQLIGDRIELVGAEIDEQEVALGGVVSARLAWQPREALDRNYSWFVHLVGPQGIAGQADVTYSPDRVAPGQPVVEPYRFTLRPGTPPGEYHLIAGVYVTFDDGSWERLQTPDGRDAVTLGTVHVLPRAEAPATAQHLSLAWADGSRLVGVDYDDSVAGVRRVYLHWHRPAGAAEIGLSLVRGGQVVGQAQLAGGAAGYRTVACDVPPGSALSLAATANGQPLAALGPWHLPVHFALPLPNRGPGARYLDLGNEMVLVGARWQPAAPQPGAALAAEFQFLSSRPLTSDYSVSLSLEGEGWRAQNDGTPAMGAIPTLKWLRGWTVRDPRHLELPADAHGPARLRLAVYDAFSLEGLAVGDERLARAGQGTQITLWEGSLP